MALIEDDPARRKLVDVNVTADGTWLTPRLPLSGIRVPLATSVIGLVTQ